MMTIGSGFKSVTGSVVRVVLAVSLGLSVAVPGYGQDAVDNVNGSGGSQMQELPEGDSTVELTGTYQRLIACAETYHLEYAQLEEPGKDKASGVFHNLDIAPEQIADLPIGAKIKVEGQRKPARKEKTTKAQLRQHMFKHVTKREGLPWNCAGMEDVMSKIKRTDGKAKDPKAAKAPCGHDHGEMELVPVADDAEVVEVHIPAHIVVKHLEIIKGGKDQ